MTKTFDINRNMMHGDIFSFLGADSSDVLPIEVDLMGTDFCHDSFLINRKNSDICVLGYVILGHGLISINDKNFSPSVGDVFILPKGSTHEYHVEKNKPWGFIWFNIKGILVDSIIQACNIERVYHIERSNVGHLFNKALEIASAENLDVHIQHKEIVLLIIEILLDIAETVRREKSCYSEIVLNIKNYLDNHIEKSISLKQLSKSFSMSQRNINRIFKKEVGVTIYDYFLDKKIRLAKTMLLNTNLSIKEISLRLNFSDVYYFSNLFKSKTEYSPLNFRKIYR